MAKPTYTAIVSLDGYVADEQRMFDCMALNPIVVGGGTPYLAGGLRQRLELLDERRSAGGVVYVRYAMAST